MSRNTQSPAPVGVNLISRRQTVIFYDDPEKPFINGQTVAIGEDGRIRHPKIGDAHCFRLTIARKEGNEVHATISTPIPIFPFGIVEPAKPKKPIRVTIFTREVKGVSEQWFKMYLCGELWYPKAHRAFVIGDIDPPLIHVRAFGAALIEALEVLKLMSETKWVSTPDNRPRHG